MTSDTKKANIWGRNVRARKKINPEHNTPYHLSVNPKHSADKHKNKNGISDSMCIGKKILDINRPQYNKTEIYAVFLLKNVFARKNISATIEAFIIILIIIIGLNVPQKAKISNW